MQGADGAECCVIEQAVTAALLDSGCRDLAVGIEDEEYQRFAFETAGDRFRRVEFTALVLLAELFPDFLLPVWLPAGWFGRSALGWRRGLGALRGRGGVFRQHQFGGWRRQWAQPRFERARCRGRRRRGRPGDQFVDERRQVQQRGSNQGQCEPVIGPEHEKMRAGLGSE